MTAGRSILVLAGTEDGRRLCTQLPTRVPLPVIASLAGATRHPAHYSVPVRTGGFGGWSGLADYLQSTSIALAIDATHPFARQISRNVRWACGRTGTPLAVLQRPPWTPHPDASWSIHASLEEALAALPSGGRVLVTLGRNQLATLMDAIDDRGRTTHWLLRTIDPAGLAPRANLAVMTGRPPFALAEEQDLLRHQGITALLCRNSGGSSGRAKLDAAAALGVPVYMIDRPVDGQYAQSVPCHESIDAALAWIETQLATL